MRAGPTKSTGRRWVLSVAIALAVVFPLIEIGCSAILGDNFEITDGGAETSGEGGPDATDADAADRDSSAKDSMGKDSMAKDSMSKDGGKMKNDAMKKEDAMSK